MTVLDAVQPLHQLVAFAQHVSGQVVVDDVTQHRKACSGRERVATKRRAVVAGDEARGNHLFCENGADRNTTSKSLRQGHDVRLDAEMLVCP